jgi:class 3 adenylate cyclase/tetratricopeptide (TPR) repeat protein
MMGATPTAGFRCHATLLFADLCDYTALAESSDPEELAPFLHHFREEMEAVIHRHHGVVNEWRGDGVLCIFGLPHATEQDAHHAIIAALEMHAAARGLQFGAGMPKSFRVRVHSGIDSGIVFARRREGSEGYDLIGDAVNTAARLCSRAGQDELLVSQFAIQGLTEMFEAESVDTLSLKGKKEPVLACRVLGRSSVSTRFAASQRRGLSPLVGREATLERLERALAESERGGLRFITIVGSPGIGKTRILSELKRRIPVTVRVLEGRSEDQPSATLLQPFIEMVRELGGLGTSYRRAEALEAFDRVLADLGPTVSSLRSVLPHLVGAGSLDSPSTNPEQVRQSFVSSLVGLFGALSQKSRLVLVLDDWHWADDLSRQVLGGLLRELKDTPTVVVVASREMGDPLLTLGEVVELQPFTHDEAARMIASILPYSFDLGLSRTIHERSGGNPLFLEELCRALPSEAPSGEEDFVGSRVPGTIRGIIRVRAERLAEGPARVLRASSVIGGEVPSWLLARVLDVPDLEQSLEVLVQSDLVQPPNAQGTFRFKHWTTREVVYEAVRLPERRALHEATARALEHHAESSSLPPPYEALARHWAGSGDHARAASYAERAGDRATALSSLDCARQQYRVALDATDKLGLDGERAGRWIRMVDKWAAACLYSPAEGHLQLIQRASELALRLGDTASAARAEYWLGWFSYTLGNLEASVRYCREALELARAIGDQRLAAQISLNLGQSLAAASDYPEALVHFDAGLDVKRQTGRNNLDKARAARRVPQGFAYALACKALVLGDLGRFSNAYACFDEAFDVLQDSGHAVEGSCLGVLGMVQLMQGRWKDALASAMRAQATAERVNGPYVFAMSKTVSGYARFMLERAPDAVSDLLHAVRWMESRGARLFISFNHAYLSDALLAVDETEQAAVHARRALDRGAHSDRLGEAMALRTLARIAQQSGRETEARAHLDAALASARARDSARDLAVTELARGGFHARRGERTEAERALDAARRGFSALGMATYERMADTARLALGQD